MTDRLARDETVSETAWDRIESVCEAFESKLRAGLSPRIEDHLEQAPLEDRPRLLKELSALDRYYRRAHFERADLTTRTYMQPENARRPVSVGRAAAPRSDDPELQNLLRRRLRMIALMSAGGFVLELLRVKMVAPIVPHILRGNTHWQYDVSVGLLILGLSVLAGMLSRGRAMPVQQLRWIETAIIVSVAGWGCWATYAYFREFLPRFIEVRELRGVLVIFLAQGLALFWVTVIFAYGLLVPNTWRRSAAAIGVLVALPLLMGLLVGSTEPGVTVGVLLLFLSSIGLWLSIAAPLALYGAYRIESLRQQVLEGQRLGQYQLKQRLGRGGMGEVYLAEHALLRRPCAVKVIHPDRAGDRPALLRFEREAQATAALTSPHTVAIYDYGHTPEGLFYYVMEYLPGIDLERLVRDHGPLPPGRVIYLLEQLCGALQEAHDKGLIHRDIKPSNVILCERGGRHDSVKLLDFGLVREVNVAENREPLTQEGWIAGTPAYLSPEQAQGQVNVDARSDIYSLGAVAYFLLVGRPPFPHRSAMRTVAAHIYEPVISPRALCESLPRDLNDVVLCCLEKEPQRRLPNVAQLREALARCESATAWTSDDARAWWSAVR